MKHYCCVANDPEGVNVSPRSLSRVSQGKYWVPDCVDYESKFNLPRRLKAREVFTGWSCYNCKFLRETTTKKNDKPQQASPSQVKP